MPEQDPQTRAVSASDLPAQGRQTTYDLDGSFPISAAELEAIERLLGDELLHLINS